MGRYYEGVYPIDFHLVLSGEEIHKGQEVSGETSVMLSVAGSYANDVMEQRVVEEWTRLWKRIRLSLRAARRRASPDHTATRHTEQRVGTTAQYRGDGDRAAQAAADAGRMDADLSIDMADAADARVRPGRGVSTRCGSAVTAVSRRRAAASSTPCATTAGSCCARDCRVVLADGAFGGPLVASDRTARRTADPAAVEHHPAAIALGSGTDNDRPIGSSRRRSPQRCQPGRHRAHRESGLPAALTNIVVGSGRPARVSGLEQGRTRFELARPRTRFRPRARPADPTVSRPGCFTLDIPNLSFRDGRRPWAARAQPSLDIVVGSRAWSSRTAQPTPARQGRAAARTDRRIDLRQLPA